MDDNDKAIVRKQSALPDIVLSSLWGDSASTILAIVVYLTGHFVDYGWGMFLLLPVVSGFIVGTYMKLRNREPGHVAAASLISVLIPSMALVFWQTEGLVCVMMAFPFAFLAHYLSAMFGGVLANNKHRNSVRISFLVLAPAAMFSESVMPQTPCAQTVSTSIVINASPDHIWPFVNNLDSIPPTSNLLFRHGVAHPTSTKTIGSGVGASRLCRLSTGDMPERITVWEPGKRLVFDVLQTPQCMKEWNPFGPVHAEHLTGYYNCHQGEFQLRQVGPNETELIGISRFDHRFGPTWYWSLWTTYIVHSVHTSVLDEIKRRAEAG